MRAPEGADSQADTSSGPVGSTCCSEHEFDPIPFDADAARAYGRVTAAVVAAGRKPRRRPVDLMIAATVIAAELPLYTTNPDDFAGLGHLVTVVSVTRPEVPNERRAAW